MKKTIIALGSILLFSFAPIFSPEVKTLKLELTIEEATAIVNAISQSKTISAFDANMITNKINQAYQVALADSAKKDTTKHK